jgi:hypothetical protein
LRRFKVPQFRNLKWRDKMRTFGKTWDRNGESSQQKQAKVSRKDSNALVANNETGES